MCALQITVTAFLVHHAQKNCCLDDRSQWWIVRGNFVKALVLNLRSRVHDSVAMKYESYKSNMSILYASLHSSCARVWATQIFKFATSNKASRWEWIENGANDAQSLRCNSYSGQKSLQTQWQGDRTSSTMSSCMCLTLRNAVILHSESALALEDWLPTTLSRFVHNSS